MIHWVLDFRKKMSYNESALLSDDHYMINVNSNSVLIKHLQYITRTYRAQKCSAAYFWKLLAFLLSLVIPLAICIVTQVRECNTALIASGMHRHDCKHGKVDLRTAIQTEKSQKGDLDDIKKYTFFKKEPQVLKCPHYIL